MAADAAARSMLASPVMKWWFRHGKHADANQPMQQGLTQLAHDARAALASFEEAARLQPDRHDIHRHIGMSAERAGDLDRAEHAYRRAAALVSDDPYVWAALAGVLERRGDFGGAAGAWRSVLGITPPLSEAWEGLGRCLEAQGRWSEAARAYAELAHRNPHSVTAADALERARGRLAPNAGRLRDEQRPSARARDEQRGDRPEAR